MKTLIIKSISFIIGIFLFAVVPIISWGLNDINGFFSNDARAFYTYMMSIMALLTVIFVPRQGRSKGEKKKSIKRQDVVVSLLQIVSIGIVFVAPFSDSRKLFIIGQSDIIRYIGVIMTFSGYILMNWAVLILGRHFSVDVTIQDDHKLIKENIYRYIRHPRYLGIIMFLSGISVVFNSITAFVISLINIAVLIWRISDEEKMLNDEFKEEWDNYVKRTWKMIPYIY